jgi:hypothetical protein
MPASKTPAQEPARSVAWDRQRPDCYVLCVGVDKYRHFDVPDLKGCVSDGVNASLFFRGQGGKLFENVYLFANGGVLLDGQRSLPLCGE